MVCYKRIPTVAEGVGVLFDTSETMQVLLGNIIEGVDLDDKYLFITDMDTSDFLEVGWRDFGIG